MRFRMRLMRLLNWFDWNYSRILDALERRVLTEDERDTISDARIEKYNAWAEKQNEAVNTEQHDEIRAINEKLVANRDTIREWLYEAADVGGARWVALRDDWDDGGMYPQAFIRSDDFERATRNRYTDHDTILAVYDLSLPIEPQLEQERAWNPPTAVFSKLKETAS